MHLSWFILFCFLSFARGVSFNKSQAKNKDKGKTNPGTKLKVLDNDEVMKATKARFAEMEAAAFEAAAVEAGILKADNLNSSKPELLRTETEKLKKLLKSVQLNQRRCGKEEKANIEMLKRKYSFRIAEENFDENHTEEVSNKNQADFQQKSQVDINRDFFNTLQKEVYKEAIKGEHKEGDTDTNKKSFIIEDKKTKKTDQVSFLDSSSEPEKNLTEDTQIKDVSKPFTNELVMMLKKFPKRSKSRWLVASEAGRVAASIAAKASREAADDAADTALSASVALKSPFASDELKQAAARVLTKNKEKASNFLMAARKADAAAAFLQTPLLRETSDFIEHDEEMFSHTDHDYTFDNVDDYVNDEFWNTTGLYYTIYDYDVDTNETSHHIIDPNSLLLT